MAFWVAGGSQVYKQERLGPEYESLSIKASKPYIIRSLGP